MQDAVGVTVGKFHPPHLGHLHLIRAAAAGCSELHVLVCERADQPLPGAQRSKWLAEAAPENVAFHVTPDDLPAAPQPWAERTLEILGRAPDMAFTSEPYGRAWATAMGCRHVAVDPARRRMPVSGSMLREDLESRFHWLVPAAKAALARRVVIVGAESTGKTTLARRLAQAVGTVWVPEHGRDYWEGRRYLPDQEWAADEFLHIARVQARLEDALARRAHCGLVFADTDALVTLVWEERYRGRHSAGLADVVRQRRPDLYLVCGLDVGWHDDGSRESQSFRRSMHARTLELVAESGVPWMLVEGTVEERLSQALAAVRTHTALMAFDTQGST